MPWVKNSQVLGGRQYMLSCPCFSNAILDFDVTLAADRILYCDTIADTLRA